MAVAFGSAKSATPAAGSTFTSASWSISGTNLAILIAVGTDVSGETVSSVSWSLGSGTPVQVKTLSTVNGSFTTNLDIWAIPAPVAGSGTYTVNMSASGDYQISADYFTGVDQTTPCPASDAMTISISSYSGSGAFTFNPTNVGAADGVYAALAHEITGDSNGWTTGTNDFENKTTAINMTCAHNLGASATCVAAALINSPIGACVSGIGVRVQGVAAATPTFQPQPHLPFIQVNHHSPI